MKSPYVVEGQPTIEVDQEYFYFIQEGSELLQVLQAHGVEGWDGYKDAKQEYDIEVEE